MTKSSDIMELAHFLAEWTLDPSLSEPQLPPVPTKDTPREEQLKQMEKYGKEAKEYIANTFGNVNEQVGQFLELFRSAAPHERIEARKIIRQNGHKPIWDAFEQWSHTTTINDYGERIRLELACLAVVYGSEYNDGSHRLDNLPAEVTAHGLDWDEIQMEYNKLAADYVPNLISITDAEMSEEMFATEMNKANAALAEQGNLPELFYQRAMLYMQKRDFDHTIVDLTKANRLGRGNTEYLYQRGRAYAAIGNLTRARQDFVSAIVSGAKNPHPHERDMRDKISEWRNTF